MYECKRCGKEFDTPNVWLGKELCPCGSDDITTIGEEKPKKEPKQTKPIGKEK